MRIKKNPNAIKSPIQDRVFNWVDLILLTAVFFVIAWPLWFVIIASISHPDAVNAGKVLLIPRNITLEGYKYMLEYKELWRGYLNTIFYTVAGTAINMVLSVCLAYPLSEKKFRLRKPLTIFVMITMYFNGGMIPNYLLMKNLHLVDTPWAMIVPGMISVYNSLIIRSYFQNSIPGELKEAATLDGANSLHYLIKIVLPLSKSVLAVVSLYYMVAHWNDFTHALYYIYDQKLAPLQSVLRDLLMSSKMTEDLLFDPELAEQAYQRAQSMKYAVIIAAVAPMMCVYPFIQKYFTKGVMVGSVKG